ncbi:MULTISPECIES: hypothetical protein [unclassified Pseudoclavibacter]|nr:MULTISPECIES: hypothetical protein [unclassified Pseudoclavibacter]MBF4550296.1 hypothetical protein [Pseudoclavibacter sp. VKM Ac-2888]
MSTHESAAESERGAERRSLLGAVAWATPIIAIAVAAPAQAASTHEVPG